MPPSRIPAPSPRAVIDWSAASNWYDTNAEAFTSSTLALDTSQIIDRFVGGMAPGASILDVGCGAGRDTKVFLDMGYQVEAIDASAEMCRATEAHTEGRAAVRKMAIQDLPEMPGAWDGIWMMASLIHLPKRDWAPALERLAASLAPAGRLYVCVKDGQGERVDDRGRPMCDARLDDLTQMLMAACPGSGRVEGWMTESVASGGENTRWANAILRIA